MRVVRSLDNLTELETKQMETINELQEKIKLLEFDNIKNAQMIRRLKKSFKFKKKTLTNIIQELELMRKEEKYTRLLIVINILKRVIREDYNE